MRIVSLNTWKCDGPYRQRLGLMAEELAALAPDVLLLQEVFATEDGHADTAAFLAQALAMHVIVSPARRKHRLFEGQSRLGSLQIRLRGSPRPRTAMLRVRTKISTTSSCRPTGLLNA
jgi:endonuclease/exonuclease/phosphatase family metal-dependent hydrolase